MGETAFTGTPKTLPEEEFIKLRYYCHEEKKEIQKLLIDIEAKHDITYEILNLSRNGVYDEEKEKYIYEREFKPRAKLLKQRSIPITELRSKKARHYFISRPGTITIIRDGKIEWYAIGDKEIIKFLKAILNEGYAFLEESFKI